MDPPDRRGPRAGLSERRAPAGPRAPFSSSRARGVVYGDVQNGRVSLRRLHPRRPLVPILLALTSTLLPLGLFLPILTVSRMGGLSRATFSVATGILDLARAGEWALALLIFTFSFVFPIVKVVTLWVLWSWPMSSESRETTLHNLKALGKWSMLDVFVVSVFVGSVQFGFLASAEARFGIYLFSSAVLLSMVVTFLEYRLARVPGGAPGPRRAPSLAAVPLAVLALLFLAAGMDLPLMEVKKWHFWSRDYTLLSGLDAMYREGSYFIVGLLALFVIAVPLATLVGQIALIFARRSRHPSAKLVSFLGFLDKWTMMDVFALGLMIVVVKIGAVADVSPRLGMGCLLAGIFLSFSTSWMIRT